MTVTVGEARVRECRRNRDRDGWLELDAPAGRMVFVGREPELGDLDVSIPMERGHAVGRLADMRAGDVSTRDVPTRSAPGRSVPGRSVPGRSVPGRSVRARGVPARRARASRRCASVDAPSLHGSRLTRRGRVVAAVAWLVLAIVAAVPVLGAVSAEAEPPPATGTAVVHGGDTVWDIARSVAPDADPREVVSAIVELNELASPGDIHAGDRLVVPAAP